MANEQQIATAQGTGDSTAIEITRPTNTEKSHLRTLLVSGTFDGATVKYQISQDNSTFFDVANADAITSNKAINVEHRAKWHRINVSGGSGSEAIDALVI